MYLASPSSFSTFGKFIHYLLRLLTKWHHRICCRCSSNGVGSNDVTGLAKKRGKVYIPPQDESFGNWTIRSVSSQVFLEKESIIQTIEIPFYFTPNSYHQLSLSTGKVFLIFFYYSVVYTRRLCCFGSQNKLFFS